MYEKVKRKKSKYGGYMESKEIGISLQQYIQKLSALSGGEIVINTSDQQKITKQTARNAVTKRVFTMLFKSRKLKMNIL